LALRFPRYIESFNGRLRDELLDGEIFYSLREARIVIESWRRHYNTIRPYASLGYCLRRVAGCATPSGSAGHASATASLKLTFHLDHSVGANQYRQETLDGIGDKRKPYPRPN
jgi:hypothetical protein